MSILRSQTVLLGCDPQVEIVVSELENGELYFDLRATDRFALTDIQGLYLNVTDENGLPDLNFFPTVDNDLPFVDVTDIAVGADAISTTSEGAALRDEYDIRIEYAPSEYTGPDANTFAQLTIFSAPLSLDDIDLTAMAVVVGTPDGPAQVLLPEGAQSDVETFETRLLTEDFNDIRDADDSDLIASDDHWDVRGNKLFTNGRNDGELLFEEVDTDGPVAFSIDARARNLDEFENGGRYGDSLRIEAQVDGGDWILLDEFRVNDAGTALVGSETGQEIEHGFGALSYSGGILDTAEDSVQFRMVSDISANNEKILFDNVQITTTEAVIADPVTAGEVVHVDFNDLETGETVADQYDGLSITAQRDGDSDASENDAMIFDSDHPTGGDRDLSYDDQGNILIVSEDNDSDDPDDEAHGGTISFAFDDPSEVVSLNVLDIEEEDGFIDLYDAEGELIDSIDIPLTGDNGQAEVMINAEGVSLMNVVLSGSGAVDDLKFIPPSDEQVCDAQYDLGTIGGLPLLPLHISEHPIPDEDDVELEDVVLA